MTISQEDTVNNLTVESGGTLTGSAGDTLILYGNFDMDGSIGGTSPNLAFRGSGGSPQTLDGDGTILLNTVVFDGSAGMDILSNFFANTIYLMSGELDAGSATISLLGTGTVFSRAGGTFTASTSTIITSASVTIKANSDLSFYVLDHSPGGPVSLTFSGDHTFYVTSALRRGSNSTGIVLSGSAILDLTGATLVYDGLAAMTIGLEWPTDAGQAPTTVQIITSATVTHSTGTHFADNLILNASTGSATLNISGGTIRVDNQLTRTNGTISESGGSFTWGTGTTTLLYNATSQQTTGPEWDDSIAPDNVTANNTSGSSPAVSLGSTDKVALDGNLTLANGSVEYTGSNNTMTVSGNIVGGSGSFGASDDTLIVTGTTSQVTSSGSTTLSNLTITSSSGSLSTITINGLLNVAPGAGNTVTLTGGIILAADANLIVASGTLDHNGQTITKGGGTNTLTIDSDAELLTGGASLSGFDFDVAAGEIECDGSGNEEEIIEVVIPVPKDYVLFHNYPNPFNPSTNLKFQLPVDTKISIHIYDTGGRLVRTLLSNVLYNTGEHIVKWNATNSSGKNVATGMYIYQFIADKVVKTGKMLFVK
jgi:hypothetical protein